MDASRLDTMVEQLQEYEDHLVHELARVRRMLAAADPDDAGTTRDGPTLASLLVDLFTDNPKTVFTAQEATAGVQTAGWTTDSKTPVNTVRAALARLRQTGEIESGGKRGTFRLASGPPVDEVAPEDPPVPEEGSSGYEPDDSWPDSDDPWASAPTTSSYDDEPPF